MSIRESGNGKFLMELTEVYMIFPELNDIADDGLRDKCAAIWR